MNNTITYSFIIPHKNNPVLLQRCVNSIPRRDDIQIVVVDDDSSVDVVDWNRFKFDDERCIEFIHTKGCKSAGAVRNEGLKCAMGKWILFADCDDYFNEGLLETLDLYKDSQLEALFFNMICIDGDSGTPIFGCQVGNSYEYFVSNYHNDKCLLEKIRYVKSPWTKMVRKDFLIKYRIRFEDVILGNDVWYSYQVGYFAKKIDVVDKRLYVYTINSNSISVNRTVQKDVVQIETYVKQNAFFRFIGHPEWHINLLGWIKYHWLQSHHKIEYTFALLHNALRIYKIRNKYVEGIKRTMNEMQ